MLSWLRTRFHPLWRLRRNPAYRWFQRNADIVVSRKRGKVREHIYLLRDMNLLMPQGTGSMEQKTGSVFDAVLNVFQPKLFLDVGANIGGYSWNVYNRLEDCEIWMFEPDRRNFGLLTRTLKSISPGRVKIFNAAVSDAEGTATFIVDDASGAAGSIVDQRGGYHNLQDSYKLKMTVTVETKTLDKLLKDRSPLPTFMKIDVEGAETMVLKGATQSLQVHAPLIVIEAFQHDSLRFLNSHDYTIYSMEEDGNFLALPPRHSAQLSLLVNKMGLRELSL